MALDTPRWPDLAQKLAYLSMRCQMLSQFSMSGVNSILIDSHFLFGSIRFNEPNARGIWQGVACMSPESKMTRNSTAGLWTDFSSERCRYAIVKNKLWGPDRVVAE